MSPAMLLTIEADGGKRFHQEVTSIGEIFGTLEKLREQRRQFEKQTMATSPIEFVIKDSGARAAIGGGVRDTEEGKTDYTLILDGIMYDRWAEHMTKGARKYAARNWLGFFKTRAGALAAYERAGRSLARHYKDYMRGVKDEDHAAAVFFNIDVRETALDIYPDLLDKVTLKTEEPALTNPPGY